MNFWKFSSIFFDDYLLLDDSYCWFNEELKIKAIHLRLTFVEFLTLLSGESSLDNNSYKYGSRVPFDSVRVRIDIF